MGEASTAGWRAVAVMAVFAVLLASGLAVLRPAPAGAASSGPTKHQRECLQSLASGPETSPAAVSVPLEPAVLASYAVFRRPASAADQIPPLSPVGPSIDSQIRSWYPVYTRQVGRIGKHRYFLIPAFLKEEVVPPASCLPAGVRAQRPQYVEAARKRANELAFCLTPAEGEGLFGSMSACETFAEAETGIHAFLGAGLGGEPTLELVPDGVATVRVSYKGYMTIVAPVSENVFSFQAPAALLARLAGELRRADRALRGKRHLSKSERKKQAEHFARLIQRAFGESQPTSIEWVAPGGQVVRVIGRPTAKQIAGILGA